MTKQKNKAKWNLQSSKQRFHEACQQGYKWERCSSDCAIVLYVQSSQQVSLLITKQSEQSTGGSLIQTTSIHHSNTERYSEKMPVEIMLSVRSSTGIQRSSKQLRDWSRERLSNRCRALSQENVGWRENQVGQSEETDSPTSPRVAQTRDQLEKDNRLNEMDINKPQKYCDPTGDANQVRNNAKRKKKTDLQEDYMEVEV